MKQLKIESIIDNAKKYGHEIVIRDVCYSLLRTVFDNDLFCYTVVFGQPDKDNTIECYEKMDKIQYLLSYFDKVLTPEEKEKSSGEIIAALTRKNDEKKSDAADITFEENKAAMIELIQRTEDALAGQKIDTDKGLKIISDLRVKLNDKFKVEDKAVEQYIIVQPKFNHICKQTRKECWLQTKDYAMQHWHLIPDPNYKEEQ